MQRTVLVLFATLAMAGTAHAQAWPNAKPSPYGATGQPAASAPTAAPAPTAATSEQLGAPPHALGGSSAASTPSQAALPAGSGPSVPNLDNSESGRATAALNVLEAQGYASFSNFGPSGNAYTALVTNNGQQFRVVINPDTGQISRQ